MANKQGKMQNYINYRMRATLNDGRQLAGQMLAFDKHMNLVLADTEEFRRVKRKAQKTAPGQDTSAQTVEVEEKRTLGLTIVRGTNIISCSVDGPPPQDPAARLGAGAPAGAAPAAMAAGPGISRSAGRGLPVGLTGPVAGISGPGPLPGFPGAPPGMAGRGGPPPGFMPPAGFPGGAPGGGPPPFQPPPGFQQPPPGQGRGFPPGFGGR